MAKPHPAWPAQQAIHPPATDRCWRQEQLPLLLEFEDPETGLVYYGYRWLSPSLGRWINRDPIEEVSDQRPRPEEMANPYLFVNNEPPGQIDAHGLKVYTSGIISEGTANRMIGNIVHRNPAKFPNLGSEQTFRALFFTFDPRTTKNRFVFTCKHGWVDLGHYFANAHFTYKTRLPLHVLVLGYFKEIEQYASAKHSYFTIEDVASNMAGILLGNAAVNWELKGTGNILGLVPDPGAKPSPPAYDVYGHWRSYMADAGAPDIKGAAWPFLVQDAADIAHEIAYTYSEAQQIKRKHLAWKCLCVGNRPKKEYR